MGAILVIAALAFLAVQGARKATANASPQSPGLNGDGVSGAIPQTPTNPAQDSYPPRPLPLTTGTPAPPLPQSGDFPYKHGEQVQNPTAEGSLPPYVTELSSPHQVFGASEG